MKPPIRRFAEGTTVTPASSRAEAEKLLTRYGATEIGLMQSNAANLSTLIFQSNDRRVKLTVKHPTVEDWRADKHKSRASQSGDWCTRELARRWRVLVLSLKVKLEICADDPTQFDREFMADILLPNQQTVGDSVLPMVAAAYEGGSFRLALPAVDK